MTSGNLEGTARPMGRVGHDRFAWFDSTGKTVKIREDGEWREATAEEIAKAFPPLGEVLAAKDAEIEKLRARIQRLEDDLTEVSLGEDA